MFVITRLRAPSPDPAALNDFIDSLRQAQAILAAKPGYASGEVGRNLDEPDLWVLSTRWENVGSYRRALSSHEGKMFLQPLMVHAVDEPSAYEVLTNGSDLNDPKPRSIG